MTVETQARYISDLNTSYPRARDLIKEGDDHIRLVKSTLKNTFPMIDKSVTISADKLNKLDSDIIYEGDAIKFLKPVSFTYASGADVSDLDPDSFQPIKVTDARYLIASKNLSDVPDKAKALANLLGTSTDNPFGNIAASVLQLVYPINSLYFNAYDDTNPNKLFGFGTWVLYANGRTLIGSGTLHDGIEQRTFAAGQGGGTFTHKLSTGEMPKHSHDIILPAEGSSGTKMVALQWDASDCADRTYTTETSGGNSYHNNMQPYITVHIWRRIA